MHLVSDVRLHGEPTTDAFKRDSPRHERGDFMVMKWCVWWSPTRFLYTMPLVDHTILNSSGGCMVGIFAFILRGSIGRVAKPQAGFHESLEAPFGSNLGETGTSGRNKAHL